MKTEKRQAIKPKGEKKLKNKKKEKRAISEVCLVEEELNKIQEAQSAPSYLQDGVKAVEEKLEQINLFLFELFGEEEKPIFVSASLGITEKESIVNFLKGIHVFAWTYDEMPGLSTDLVCHSLHKTPHTKSVKQPGQSLQARNQERN